MNRAALAPAFLAVLLAAAPAAADVCLATDQATAEEGARRIREAGRLYYEDWFQPIAVNTVEVRPWDAYWGVVVNDALEVDLAYAYLPEADGSLTSLGWQLPGCGEDAMPKTAPAQPFAAEAAGPMPAPDPAARRILGLVEIPSLDEAYMAMADTLMPIDLMGTPAHEGAPVAGVHNFEGLVTHEIDYDRLGAVVYERAEGNWYRIATPEHEGWLAPEDAGPFHSVPDLLAESLVYLDEPWDNRLLESPDASAPRQVLDPAWRAMMGDLVAVSLVETKEVAGETWHKIDIVWPNPCDADAEEQPAAVAIGWVPAYAPSGAANLWYFSRGC